MTSPSVEPWSGHARAAPQANVVVPVAPVPPTPPTRSVPSIDRWHCATASAGTTRSPNPTGPTDDRERRVLVPSLPQRQRACVRGLPTRVASPTQRHSITPRNLRTDRKTRKDKKCRCKSVAVVLMPFGNYSQKIANQLDTERSRRILLISFSWKLLPRLAHHSLA